MSGSPVRLTTLVCSLFVLMMGYGLFNLFWSHYPTDDGLFLGMSWRIFHGEIPHREFIYLRPPLTPIIHTIWYWFPERLTFPLARASFYLWHCLIVVTAFFFGARRFCHNRESCLVLAAFAVLGFFWGMHNMPAMPWYTVDSVLFCSLGLLVIAWGLERRESMRWPLLWGGILLGLAPWSKQNFAILPIWVGFFLGFQTLIRKVRWREILPFAVGVAIPSVLFVLFLQANGALANFVEQIRAVSSVRAVTRSAIGDYLDSNYLDFHSGLFLVALVLGVLAAVVTPLWNRWAKLPASVLLALGIGGAGFFCCWRAGYLLFTALVAFILASLLRIWIVGKEKTEDGKFVCLCFLGLSSIVLAWTSQVSWAWRVPLVAFGNLLVVTGMIAVSEEGQYKWVLHKPTKAVVYCLLGLAVGMTFYRVETLRWKTAYKDRSVFIRGVQDCNLASIFPRFGHYLYTNQTTCHRFQILKDILTELDSTLRVVVMPEFPLIYYLSDRRNPVGIDWWWPPDYQTFEAKLQEQLRLHSDVVLLEGKPPDQDCAQGVTEEGTLPPGCHRARIRADQRCSEGIYAGAVEKWVSSHFIFSKRIDNFCLYVNPSGSATNLSLP
jgi:hypothetical protein